MGKLTLRRDVYSVRLVDDRVSFLETAGWEAATRYSLRYESAEEPLCEYMTVDASSSSLLRMSCARVQTLSARRTRASRRTPNECSRGRCCGQK